MYYQIYDTIIGKLVIEEDECKISRIELLKNEEKFDNKINKETDIIKKVYKELDEYFKGNRKTFDIHLKIEGTEFQKRYGWHF